jgi:hypothetical protein
VSARTGPHLLTIGENPVSLRAADLIAFDPAVRWFAPRDLLEMGQSEEGYISATIG